MHFRLLAIAVLLGWSQAVFSAEDGGREHVIPLFMASDDELDRQGFMRVINHSDRSGTVEIRGYDDQGMEYEPIELSLDARQTLHFNSDHLEGVESRDGLDGGLDNGMGHWRLVLTSTLDIEPLAYFRNKTTGFLASMHDVVSQGAMQHYVRFFNPASNPNQLSWLRVINPGDVVANITITGVDDNGDAGAGSVSGTVPAGGAYSITAVDLEAEGLGDGHAKWSLNVSSDQAVQVMSLMDVPGGYLSNLSGGRRDYRGAAGLYQVSFPSDMDGGDPVTGGLIILLPDSRLYAWLPETADTNRIARGTYDSSAGMVSGEGVVYESGKQGLDGVTPVGGADEVSLTAEFRSGDWIRGEYTVLGEDARAFRGWAFTGFERGGSAAAIQGTWSPMGDNPDLPATLAVEADGMFEGSLTVDAEALGELECGFSATLVPVNPAFNAYHANPAISCLGGAIILGGEDDPDEVEMFMSVMDAPDMPGTSNRAIVFAILPREVNEIGLGALYELTRE